MRKIFCLLLMLLPFGLLAQNDFVRHIVTPEGEVTFWRGTQQLWVSAITSPPVYEATYYVAPWGDDDNPGTFEEPFQSWQKGFYHPDPGDTVYFRGGEYEPINPYSSSTVVYLGTGQGGTIGNPKNIFNYPGEHPVLNCYTADRSIYIGIRFNGASDMNVRGLEIKNCLQALNGSNIARGIRTDNANRINFENVIVHDIQGAGITNIYGTGDTVTYINCDSYNNYDLYSGTPGAEADGFLTYDCDSLSKIIYFGCRSWMNSDDGFDTYWHSGTVTYDSCWAFADGYASGSGFKMGPLHLNSSDSTRRIYRNCLAADNHLNGWAQNSLYCPFILYNCIGYSNDEEGGWLNQFTKVSILRNNIFYDNGGDYEVAINAESTHDHNDWDSEVTVTDADFVSLDVNQLDNPRQADGSLPVVTYLHLVEGSDLIDAGVDVGLDYEGDAPDIGYAESNY